MTSPIRILYVDDYPLDRQLVRDALEKEHGGFQVTEAASRAGFEAALAKASYDLVLSDFNILGFEGLQVLDAVHARDARIPVVIVTGTGSEEVAVEAMKRGAADYVIKTPKHIQRLPITIHTVLEKKYLEEERKRAEERFRNIYENAVEGIYQSTLDGRYLNVNPAMAHIYGFDSPQDMMMQVMDIKSQIYVHSQDRADFIHLLIENGKVENFEVQNFRKDRSIFWIQTNARLVQTGKGAFIEGFVTDITKSKRAEAALRDSEARLHTVVEASPLPLTINSTEEGIILYGNSALSKIMGVPLSEIVGQRAADCYADVHERSLVLAEFKQRGSLHDYEVRLRRPDGVLVWVSLSIEEITFEGQPCLLSCFYDITERKQAESLQDAVYQISEAANKAVDLDELFQAVHAIIGQVMIAHNFYIALYDDESDLISFPYYVDEMDRFTPSSISAARPGRGMTEYVIRTGKPLLSDIANFEELVRRGEVELVGPPSPIWIGAPLIIDGRTIGVIAMQDYADPNVYTERELRMLEYVSGQVAKAIERTRLYSDIRRRNQILSALQESTLILMGRVNLTEVLQTIVTQILQLMDTPNGFLYLVEPDGKNLKMSVGLGINSDSMGLMLKLGEGLAGKIWKTHQPLVVQDYHNWVGRSRQFEEFEIRAMVGVPLLSGSQTIGVLGVDYMDASRSISYGDVELLTRFAQLASIALENAQYYQAARDELKDRIRAEAALIEAEAKYRALVERLPAVVYTSDLGRAGVWHYVSPQIDSLLGFTPEEWMADPTLWYRQLHPDDRGQQEALEEQSYARGEPFEGEYRIFTREGREIWIRDSAQILSPREGELPIVQGVLVDITERKQAEENLRTTEAKYRTLVEHISAITYTALLDDAKTRVYVSPQIETLLGYTQAEYLADANLWKKMLHPDDQGRVLAEAAQFYETGEPFATDYRSVARDGRVLWFHDEAVISKDENSQQRYIQGVKINITALKQAEEALGKAHDDLERLVQERTAALSQANTLLQTMLDHIPDHIFFKDLHSRFIRNSRSQAEMLGLSDPSEVVGKSDFDFFPHAQQAYNEEQSIIRSGQAKVDFEEYVIWPNGRETWVSTTKVPLRDEQGRIVGTFGIARDITERKRADEALRKAKDELEVRVAERTSELNETNEKLRLELGERKRAEENLRSAEARYRSLVEQLPIVVYVSPADDICSTTYISPQIKTFLGYSQEEWLKNPNFWSKALHPQERMRVLAQFESVNKSGESPDMEYRMLAKDGSVVWIREQATLLRDNDGAPLMWQGLMIDITERKQAENQIKRQVDYLKALRMIDMTITASADLHLSLQTILRQAISQLQVDATDILLLNPTTHILEYADGTGFFTRDIERSYVRIGEGHAGRAAMERKMVSIHSLYESKEHATRRSLLDGENFSDYYGVPLIAKGEVKGVLEVFYRSHIIEDQEWIDFLEALAGQAGLAIDNATLFQNLQHSNLELGMAYESTLEGWSAALDLRDKETEGHTLRVTNLTLQLAEHMGLKDKDLMQIRRGALLHDIGKMGVPDRILLKPDNLTNEEWEIMQRHPVYAHELLSRIEYLRPALGIPYCHHEKWNGSGYPRGLKGEEIPLEARVFSVVDVYDALVSDRPYRPAWTKEKALEYIRSLSGIDFDPRVVDGFLELLKQY